MDNIEIKQPSLATVKKYGLTIKEWWEICNKQNGVCFVCKKLPKSGRLCVDHEHVKLWKKKPPEERKLYVRGLLCFFCNTRYCGRAITIEKALNVAQYLKEYKERLESALSSK